jgi:hypothetical protein
MKSTLSVGALLCASLFVSVPAIAKDKVITLSPEDAAALQGKTVALTTHERPSFIAMTAGKVLLGPFGVAAMAKAGNDMIDKNKVADPAVLVREQLSAALRDNFGAQLQPLDTTPTKKEKAKDLVALHPESDYVLDVRSAGWSLAYFATDNDRYWLGYDVKVQLLDAKTGRLVSNAACGAHTRDNKQRPSYVQLQASEAQLLKDITTALGWTCVSLLGKEQFKIAAEKVPAIPEQYVDPLAALAPKPAAPAAPAEVATPAEAAAPAEPTPQAGM